MPSSKKLAGAVSRLFGGLLSPAFDKTKVFGLENLPGWGFLLLPNNLIGRDVVLLESACPRPIRYIVDESVYRGGPLNRFFRSRSSVKMSSVRTEEAVCEAANRIRKGEIVCIVPEVPLGGLETSIQLCKEHERIAKLSERPVVPVWLDEASTSSFPSKRQQLLVRGLRRFPAPTSIAFGRPISKDDFDIGLARERLLELGEFCFEKRPSLDEHLGRATVRGLRGNQFREAIIDGIDHRRIKGGALLAVSIAVSRRIKRQGKSFWLPAFQFSGFRER